MGIINGACTGTSASKYNLWIDYSIGTANVAGNYTPVTVNEYLQRNDGYAASAYDVTSNPYKWTKYDDANLSAANGAIDTRNSALVLLKSTLYNVPHNPDGTKVVKLQAGFTLSNSALSGGSVTGNVTLPSIARASTVVATNAYIGNATTITITRASTSFTHTLRYAFSDLSGTIATGVATSHNWTVPTSFYAKIPNATSGVCTVYCDTYNGADLVGTSSITFTASVNPATNAPTLSAVIADVKAETIALTGDAQKMIKGHSDAGFTITATGQNSATIVSRRIDCGALFSTAASGTLSGVTSGSFTITTTDSRGFSTTITQTKTLINYVSLVFDSSCSAIRKAPYQDGKAQLIYSGSLFNGNFGAAANALTLQYRIKESGGAFGSYITLTPTVSGNTFNNGSGIELTGLDYTKIYILELKATDLLNTSGTVSTLTIHIGRSNFNARLNTFTHNTPVLTSEGIYFLKSGKTKGSTNLADYDLLKVVDGILYINGVAKTS